MLTVSPSHLSPTNGWLVHVCTYAHSANLLQTWPRTTLTSSHCCDRSLLPHQVLPQAILEWKLSSLLQLFLQLPLLGLKNGQVKQKPQQHLNSHYWLEGTTLEAKRTLHCHHSPWRNTLGGDSLYHYQCNNLLVSVQNCLQVLGLHLENICVQNRWHTR